MSKKKEQEAERKAVFTRRALLLGGAAALGGLALWKFLGSGQRSILEAKTLGGIAVETSGAGRPIVYLAQVHPSLLFKSGSNETNIGALSRAALEAYDNYGVRALLVEGITPGWVSHFQAKRTIPEKEGFQGNYRRRLEQLLCEREWHLIPDSRDALAQLEQVQEPVRKRYDECVKDLTDQVNVSNSQYRAGSEEVRNAFSRIRTLRNNYQQQIDRLVDVHGPAMYTALFTNRENALYDACLTALEHEPAILAIYGVAHARHLQQRAQQEGRGFVLVQDPRAIEVMSHDDPADVKKWYVLPEVKGGK